MKTQPAIKSYFFGKGFRDLKDTIVCSFENNIESSRRLFSKGPVAGSPWEIALIITAIVLGLYVGITRGELPLWFVIVLVIFSLIAHGRNNFTLFWCFYHYASGLAVVVFGTLMFSILSVVHVVLLGLVAGVYFATYMLVWSADALYRAVNRIFTACPWSDCYGKHILPVYHCKVCNRRHTQLWPGKYGIFHRTCLCGARLPTTFFNGRSRLYASCPDCGNRLESQETRPVVIPIIGAVSAGKTTFLFRLLNQLHTKYAPAHNREFVFANNYNQQLYNHNINLLARGGFPEKTQQKNPIAFNFFLQKGQRSRLFFFFDAAGEAFSQRDSLFQHKFYNYFHALVFVIDPFSLPEIRYRYHELLKSRPDIRPSQENLDDVFDITLNTLQQNYHVRVDKAITRPVAIVITKTDAFDLDKIMGMQALELYQTQHGHRGDRGQILDQLCRQFLRNNGAGSLLAKMESKFARSRFFPVSAAGNHTTGMDLVADWLIKKLD